MITGMLNKDYDKLTLDEKREYWFAVKRKYTGMDGIQNIADYALDELENEGAKPVIISGGDVLEL